MPETGSDELLKTIRQGDISSVYYIYGRDILTVENATKAIFKKKLGKDWREKQIRLSQAIGRQKRTALGSEVLWEQVSKPMIQKNIDLGNIIGDISLDEI